MADSEVKKIEALQSIAISLSRAGGGATGGNTQQSTNNLFGWGSNAQTQQQDKEVKERGDAGIKTLATAGLGAATDFAKEAWVQSQKGSPGYTDILWDNWNGRRQREGIDPIVQSYVDRGIPVPDSVRKDIYKLSEQENRSLNHENLRTLTDSSPWKRIPQQLGNEFGGVEGAGRMLQSFSSGHISTIVSLLVNAVREISLYKHK